MRKVAGCIPENDRRIIDSIVKEATSLTTTSIEHISGRGMNNAVTLVTTTEGRFVVRTNLESHLFRFQREAWCYEQLKDTEVLTPDVISCGVLNDHSYSVALYIEESSPINDSFDEVRVWKTLGRYATHLNKIARPAIDDEASNYFPVSWEEQVELDIEIIFKEDFWINQAEIVAEDQERLKYFLRESASTSLQHGVCQFDMTCANAVIQNSNYDKIYLLDLESANIAPVPHYQLACIAADKGSESCATKAYFEGYGVTGSKMSEIEHELNRFILYRLMRGTAWARDRYPTLVNANLKKSLPFIDRIISKLHS